VKWLTEYIQNLRTCTCLLVSHDTKFLDAVCTNIIHYENLKLKSYRGNLVRSDHTYIHLTCWRSV
jgi:elongation factor 3